MAATVTVGDGCMADTSRLTRHRMADRTGGEVPLPHPRVMFHIAPNMLVGDWAKYVGIIIGLDDQTMIGGPPK